MKKKLLVLGSHEGTQWLGANCGQVTSFSAEHFHKTFGDLFLQNCVIEVLLNPGFELTFKSCIMKNYEKKFTCLSVT